MTDSRQEAQDQGPVILLTGAAGFLGQAILRELSQPDSPISAWRELRLLDIAPVAGAEAPRVRAIRADIRDRAALRDACEGVDVVLHCAALVDWGRLPDEEVESVNLGGTEAIIEASRGAGVKALVHTSTLDVVYTGEPIVDGDETLPYPERFVNVYCSSKAAAEQVAIAANDSSTERSLRTVVIRPCSIWGEGDPYHAASLIEMAKSGPVTRIGDGSARSQHSYVGNVAHGLLLAARALLDGRDDVAGEVFFITDFPAKNFFDYMEPMVLGAGYQMLPWSLSLPERPLFHLGAALEATARLIRPVYRFTPILSRFAVSFVCNDFTLRGDKAQRMLGYEPRFNEVEAFERTIEYFRASKC
jgi:nucleoside-diphosphate-sugar epimerase